MAIPLLLHKNREPKHFMRRLYLYLICLLALVFQAGPNNALAQSSDENVQMEAVQALEHVLITGRDLDPFIQQWLGPSYRETVSTEEMKAHIMALHKAVSSGQALDLEFEENAVLMIFSDGVDETIVVSFGGKAPAIITNLALREKKQLSEMSISEQRNAAQKTRTRAIEGLGSSGGDEQLDGFMREHMEATLQNQFSREEWYMQLRLLRKAIAMSGVVKLMIDGSTSTLQFRGPSNVDVAFELTHHPPFLLNAMRIHTEVDVSDEETEGVQIEPVTWDTLAERLDQEVEKGASGAVLVARDGEIILRREFGLADRERARPVTATTVFGLGSIPIDFTRAAILKLVDDGRLKLTDPLSTFFSDVPGNKAAITIRQLMTGRSGLPNFHHRAELDDDFDLTWIDRNEAIRRIFEQPLLFKPGTDQSPSHSSFVLQAAIVEVVSGQTYGEYLNETFFTPIGMKRTGFYGDKTRFKESDMAVGYGESKVGNKNMPMYWGPTSWLIMGSGGMVSTIDDLNAWIQAMYAGEFLSPASMEVFGYEARAGGISDRGFLVSYAHNAEGTVIYLTNTHASENDHSMALGTALMRMVGE